MNLSAHVSPELAFPDLESTDRYSILRTLAEKVAATGAVKDADVLYTSLIEREELGSTAMGGGVAIPHCKLDGIDKVVIAVGTVPGGVDVDAPDQQDARLFFLVVSPTDNPAEHLKCLATISKWVRDSKNVERVTSVHSSQEICRCLASGDDT